MTATGAQTPGDAGAPDWKALYLELATALGAYERVRLEVDAGKADGGDYWKARGELDRLLGAALSWRDTPDLYADLLRKQAARRAISARPGAVDGEAG